MPSSSTVSDTPALTAAARIVPFAVFIALLAVRGVLSDAIDTRWLYPLQAGAALVALLVFARRYDELRIGPRGVRSIVSTLLVGSFVFVVWIHATSDWMRIGEPVTTFVPVRADGSLMWGLIGPRIAGAILVVPLIEELFWRSLVMRWIDRRAFLLADPRASSGFAFFASSALFALGHDQWLAGLVAGVAYAGLYRFTANLWTAIGAHALTNLLLGLWVVQQRAWGFW